MMISLFLFDENFFFDWIVQIERHEGRKKIETESEFEWNQQQIYTTQYTENWMNNKTKGKKTQISIQWNWKSQDTKQ